MYKKSNNVHTTYALNLSSNSTKKRLLARRQAAAGGRRGPVTETLPAQLFYLDHSH